jgi:hypothetical protein
MEVMVMVEVEVLHNSKLQWTPGMHIKLGLQSWLWHACELLISHCNKSVSRSKRCHDNGG